MCCLFFNLHRHQIHLISYGCVAFGLISTGLVFTVFAIFQKDTQVGKIWLAGPTTMVVGLVLVGKVMIDWGPAMMHGRHGSIDSVFLEQMQMGMANGDNTKMALPRTPIIIERPGLKFNGDLKDASTQSLMNGSPKPNHLTTDPGSLVIANQMTSQVNSGMQTVDDAGLDGAIDCIVYGQYESASSNSSFNAGLSQKSTSNAVSTKSSKIKRHDSKASSHRSTTSTPMPPPLSPLQYAECRCAHMVGRRCTASKSTLNSVHIDYGTMTSVSPPTLSTPPTPPTPPARTHNSGPSPSSPATPTSSQLERRMSERPIIIPVRPPPPPPPRSAHLYQGETFVINERSYFI